MPTTNIANGSSNPSNPECIQSGRAASLAQRYFARQLLTADDLTADQQHVLARFRRHNRLLHGWGVVFSARGSGRCRPRNGPSWSSRATSSARRGTRS